MKRKTSTRLISILLCLVMLTGLLPTSAFTLSASTEVAADDTFKSESTASIAPIMSDDDVTYFESDTVVVEEITFSTSAMPAALDEGGKVQLKKGNYARYIDRVDIPDYAMKLYETLEEAADNDGYNDFLIDVTKAQNISGYYVIPLTQFSGSYSGDKNELDTIIDAKSNEVWEYIQAVAGAFDRDHPEVFWLSGRWSYLSSGSSSSTTYTQSIYLLLQSSTYDIRRDEYKDPDTLRDAIKERDANVQAILEVMPADTVSTSEMMLYFNDWLTKNNEYNTAVSSGNSSAADKIAWECISALQGNTGTKGPVCEGYARAFMVLCMEVGIPCVLVSGDAGEAHMWNYVQIGDSWYGVDVTWNDPVVAGKSGKESGHEREDYMFVGADTVVSNGKTFSKERTVENSVLQNGLKFTNGPELSKDKYDGKQIDFIIYGKDYKMFFQTRKSATAGATDYRIVVVASESFIESLKSGSLDVTFGGVTKNVPLTTAFQEINATAADNKSIEYIYRAINGTLILGCVITGVSNDLSFDAGATNFVYTKA